MYEFAAAAALPYQGPTISTVLTLSSFVILLNVVNHVLDRLVYSGLVAQGLIGVAFVTAGAKWLDRAIHCPIRIPRADPSGL